LLACLLASVLLPLARVGAAGKTKRHGEAKAALAAQGPTSIAA
jgi:hypothetical protein